MWGSGHISMPLLLLVLLATLASSLPSLSTCPTYSTSISCPSAATLRPTPYGPDFIPIVEGDQCAMPPALLATDGCDDVCLLANCCTGWRANRTGSVGLPDGTTVGCPFVDCGNVCRMACEREGTAEACNTPCSSISSKGRAYLFGRPGVCKVECDPRFMLPLNVIGPTFVLPIPNFLGCQLQVNAACPTHTGFGFEVSPGMFLFGSVENGPGRDNNLLGVVVFQDHDNGFWMTTGTLREMLATFANPWASCFHGALETTPYTDYEEYTVQRPDACSATRNAEALYHSGYDLSGNNCANAAYNVLSAYGVDFRGVSPGGSQDWWCPGSWFDAVVTVPGSGWRKPRLLTKGTPASATYCTGTATVIAPSCGASVVLNPPIPSPPVGNSSIQCPNVEAGGDCNPSAQVFQGLTSACPCLAGVNVLECSCGPGPASVVPPICSNKSIILDSNCGVCHCPDQTASCLYGCYLL